MIGLLLAAGSGRRFGGDKLLARLPDGTPVGVATARALHPVVDGLLIGVRAHDAALAACYAEAGFTVLPCADAGSGMGHTLAALVRALPQAFPEHGQAAVLVALADMPGVQSTTLRALAEALRAGHGLVRPAWQGKPGHPVGFAAAWRPALAQLQGDTGARALVAAQGDACHVIECDDAGILLDIDTPADLQALSSSMHPAPQR